MCALKMALYDAQVGATVGRGEYRVQAAEALIASMKSSAASSPETVEKILQASCKIVLSDVLKPQMSPACSNEQGQVAWFCEHRR